MAVDLLEQIGLMLAKADSTTEAERDMILSRAQTLASRYQIDLAKAAQANQQRQRREAPTTKMVRLAEKPQRGLAFFVELFCVIARNNDLKIDMAKNSTAVWLYGFPSDIALAEMLYTSLAARMVQDAEAYLKSDEHKNDIQRLEVKRRIEDPHYDPWTGKYVRYRYEWDVVEKRMPGMTARRNFYTAFTDRVGQRLREARKAAVNASKAEEIETPAPAETAGPGTELVLLRKAEEVHDYYKSASSAKGSYRGASLGRHANSAKGAGRDSADAAHLGRADRELPGRGKGLPR